MKTAEKTLITVSATIDAPVEKVWEIWTNPKHIIKWNNASDDWHTPSAENDLRAGGKFLSRMEARDKSWGFDFTGVYTSVETYKLIEYNIADGRKVLVTFTPDGNRTTVTETFEAESENPAEMQQQGWQSILNNFKKYAESNGASENEKLRFEINIKAPATKVYNTMLNDETYRQWTSEFNPTSHYIGSWEKGQKILFLGTDANGNLGGMVSRINENITNQFISIEHLGLVQEGKEILSGPEVDDWAGALENYTFSDMNGSTRLTVEMDSNENLKDYFMETWPKALDKLKAICESQ
jgi:uncharacterized protein YndB with AHSA1/START domain